MLGPRRHYVSIGEKIVVPLRAERARKAQTVHLYRRRTKGGNAHSSAIAIAVKIDEDIDVALGDSARAFFIGERRDVEKMIGGLAEQRADSVRVAPIRESENFALAPVVQRQQAGARTRVLMEICGQVTDSQTRRCGIDATPRYR